MNIDAHCHTNCSDGNVTIEERIDMIKAAGYQAATITDHDFISGEQVRRATQSAGDMPYIPGIEFSLMHKEQVFHLLGYFVEPDNPALQAHIQKVQEVDRDCTQTLLAAAGKYNLEFGIEDLIAPSLHTFYSLQFVKRFARDKFDYNPVSMMAAFHELCAQTGLTYPRFAPWAVRDAIDLIHQAGGIAVAAHPGGSQNPTMQALQFLVHSKKDIQEYVDWGLDGIEVSHPCHAAEEKQFYAGLAQDYGLLSTAGSDCHGDDPFLGQAMMGVFTDIPENLYDAMLACYQEKTQR